MEYRDFGKTGLKTSLVGLGGVVVAKTAQEEANRIVAEAIDEGLNYIDVAPMYWDAEERLGPALVGKRDKVILACKTTDRTKDGAAKYIEESLKKMKTDHFDIYQLHGIRDLADLDKALGPGGSMETILDARERGITRFIGITTHTADIAMEALDRFPFDSILFPINFVRWFEGDNGPQVLKKAAERGMGVAAMKSMALTNWPEGGERSWEKCWYKPVDEPELVALAARFTLSQDVDLIIPSGHYELFRIAMKVAKDFKPIQPDEVEYLREKARGVVPIYHREACS